MTIRKHASPLLLITMLLAPSWVACSSSEDEGNPFEGDADAAAAGAILFEEEHCVDCHEADGSGSSFGPDIRDAAENNSDAAIFDVIQNGSGDMSDFAYLSDDEIWQLVTYLRSWSE